MSQPDKNTPSSVDVAVLSELSKVQGQLSVMMQLMQSNHQATQMRIEDFRKEASARFENLEGRMGRLEENERKTAISAAATGAVSGAIVAAGIAALKLWR